MVVKKAKVNHLYFLLVTGRFSSSLESLSGMRWKSQVRFLEDLDGVTRPDYSTWELQKIHQVLFVMSVIAGENSKMRTFMRYIKPMGR